MQKEKIIFSGYKEKLKGKVYGLLCEREKNGEWMKFLDSIYVECMGAYEELRSINYYSLMFKLGSLKYVNYEYFRKTIFEIMDLLDGVYKA